jgi:hypothetical protein
VLRAWSSSLPWSSTPARLCLPRRYIGAVLVFHGLHFATEDAHRLTDALCECRQLGCTEQQQDDRENNEQVPSSQIAEHPITSFGRPRLL